MAVDWSGLLGWGEEQLKELRSLGYDYLAQGHYERALSFFEGLIVLGSKLPYDHQTLGALYLQRGKLEQAKERLEAALELEMDHLPTQLNRAKTLLMLGSLEEGLAAVRMLEGASDPKIAGPAAALRMSYEETL